MTISMFLPTQVYFSLQPCFPLCTPLARLLGLDFDPKDCSSNLRIRRRLTAGTPVPLAQEAPAHVRLGCVWCARLRRLESALDGDGTRAHAELLGRCGSRLVDEQRKLAQVIILADKVDALRIYLELRVRSALGCEGVLKAPLASSRLVVLGLADYLLLWRQLRDHNVQIRRRGKV